MYSRFELVLMVTDRCNMDCDYCYLGAKSGAVMGYDTARAGIDRALASLERGGVLELGFFGGEPLLEADLVAKCIDYAHRRAYERGLTVETGLTTNGTVRTAAAWKVMTMPGLSLSISHDGVPHLHDRHRRFIGGDDSSLAVMLTMRRLRTAEKKFRVVTVVRPDTVDSLVDAVAFLSDLGSRGIDLTLDLWTEWTERDVRHLEDAISRTARLWRRSLPKMSVNWFDEAAARLAGVPISQSARCGFGDGQIAVAPSGSLYPCERLIGSDDQSNPMRLAGEAAMGADFLGLASAPERSHESCSSCAVAPACAADCRCSNYVRTGDVSTPDELLCAVNRAVVCETTQALMALEKALAERG